MNDDNKAIATAISIEVIGMVAEALMSLQASMAQTQRSEQPAASGTIENVSKNEIEAEVAIETKREKEIDNSASLVTSRTSEVAAPWDDLAHVQPKGLNIKLDPELHVKMTWLTNNLPKMSLQKIVMNGTSAEVERLLALHYKQ